MHDLFPMYYSFEILSITDNYAASLQKPKITLKVLIE